MPKTMMKPVPFAKHAIARVLMTSLALLAMTRGPAFAAAPAAETAPASTEPTDATVVQADDPAAVVAPPADAAAASPQQADAIPAFAAADAPPADAASASPEVLDTIPVPPLVETEAESRTDADPGLQQIDEVIVTATKRSQTVRQIPTTVNVLTGEKLESQGAHQLSDFIDQVPGIKMQDQAGVGPRKITVRGVGPDTNTNQTVGTVLGDIPLGDPYGSYTVVDPDPFDLQTVEVLKGPQGSLFGASSLSGLIRYVPNAPVLGTWAGKAFAEWTSIRDGDSAPAYGAMINVPVGSTLALRGAGTIEHAPGYVDFDTPGYSKRDADDHRKKFARVMALWQPTDRLTINLLGMEQKAHGEQMSWVDNEEAVLSRDDAPTADPYRREFKLAALDARYAFDWATLVSLSGYQEKSSYFDQDITYNMSLRPLARQGISIFRGLRDVHAHGFAQELRLVSPDDGPWTWLAGAFYSDYDADIESNVYIPLGAVGIPALDLVSDLLGLGDLGQGATDEHGIPFGKQVLSPLTAKEQAVFGELSRTIGSVKITVGGRWYRTRVEGVSMSSGLAAAIANQQPVTIAEPQVESKGFSPKFAVAWQVSRDVLIYSSAAKGFQFGGINVVPIPIDDYPPTYDSSTLWSYEAGIRTDWLDRTLRADLAVFYLDWKNAQVFQIGSSSADSWVDNVGSVGSKGIEATLRYLLPLKGASIEVTGAYLDARTREPFSSTNGEVESGTVMPNSPPFQASTTLAYSNAFFDSWLASAAFIYTHTNGAWNDIAHDARLDARDVLNFNFSLSRIEGALRPTVAVVVSNITNEIKKVSVNGNGLSTALNGNPILYSRPRTVQVRFSVDF
jgi:outer membrane receptor protein involved in Fe transport